MHIVSIVLILFSILELGNIIALYFKPTMSGANTVGMFKAWYKSKEDSELSNFTQYLIFWIAGSKLMFIFLIFAIVIFGDINIQRISAVSLALSALVYYWKMNPLIRIMDKKSELNPTGYSKTLGLMILGIVFTLLISAVIG